MIYNDFRGLKISALGQGVPLPEEKQPGCCIGCDSCEQVCPQMMPISQELAKLAKKMAG